MKRLFIIGLLLSLGTICARPFPLQFSISLKKIVTRIPEKKKDFVYIVPRELNTYIYTEEEDYYRDYQESYYAITCAKGGWDCMRHYEILANGCIPYFIDLESCNPDTMKFLPKKLILEAMNLPGVHCKYIDHSRFDKKRYHEILQELIEYTKAYLTAQKMAEYVLKCLNYKGGSILYLSQDVGPDYLRCCTLAGLKELLGDKVIDVPKIEHIYTNYPGDVKALYGKGFSYTKIVDDVPVDRDNIQERIKNHEFDLIIYGSVHRGTPYLELVTSVYKPEEIAYICGEDAHRCEFSDLTNLFLREFDALCSQKAEH